MNAIAERATIEGSQIVPDSRLTQGLVCHPRHESGRCVTFPLDESHSSISGFGDVEPEVETGISGTEGNAAQLVAVGLETGT